MHRTLFASLVALAAALCLPHVAAAQGTARAFLEAKHEEVNGILRQEVSTDAARTRRSAQLTRILNDLLDYDALSEAALSDHWEARSPEERTQFVALLRQLVERNYENNLERILEFEVEYGDERARGDRTLVTTSARSRTQRRQPPVEIEYTLRRDGRRWRVVDVTTDGVSMVRNYRDQFNRIITRDGWAELISRMERRLEDDHG
ncbi:MAG: ABC transporter substrate-binding protein [Sandaracinaceae bacterium]|nr:ABC transporter substrate-binding protein [Sandaracinaceae bacterium]